MNIAAGRNLSSVLLTLAMLAAVCGCRRDPPTPEGRQPGAAAWEHVAAPEVGIAFDMPGRPSRASDKLHSLGGIGDEVSYAFTAEDGSEFHVGIVDLPGDASPASAAATLKGTRNALIAGDRSQLIDERNITLGDHPGLALEFDVVASKRRILARVYVIDSKLCQLIAAPRSVAARADAERFLASVRLAEAHGK